MMNQDKRLEVIMQTLEKNHTLTLQEIMKLTGASRDTVRRDIVKLSDSDLVKRNYGGISLPHTFRYVDDFLSRTDEMTAVKQVIAQAAAKLVQEQQQLFLDVSTTINCIPAYLPKIEQGLVLTNSLDIADQLLRKTELSVRLIGGVYQQKRRGTNDSNALRDLLCYRSEITFISAVGLTTDGVYYAFEDDVAFKQQLAEQSQQVVLVIDHTRIGMRHNFRALGLEKLDYLVTDQSLPDELARQLDDAKVRVIVTDKAKK